MLLVSLLAYIKFKKKKKKSKLVYSKFLNQVLGPSDTKRVC